MFNYELVRNLEQKYYSPWTHDENNKNHARTMIITFQFFGGSNLLNKLLKNACNKSKDIYLRYNLRSKYQWYFFQ